MSKTSSKKAIAKQHERDALQLRIEGRSFEAIALELGMSPGGAYSAYKRADAKADKFIAVLANEHRSLWNHRIEDWLDKLRPKIETGDVQAIGMAVRLCERHCKMNGIDVEIGNEESAEAQALVLLRVMSSIVDDRQRELDVAKIEEKQLGSGKVLEGE